MNIVISFLVGVSVAALYCLIKYINSSNRLDLSSAYIMSCSLAEAKKLFSKLETLNLPAGKHVVDGHDVIFNEHGQCIWNDVVGCCGPAAYVSLEQKA